MSYLFQVGTVGAFLQGVYDSDIDFKQISLHGDTGIGTFNGVDGELIGLDGIFYRIDAEGVAHVVKPHLNTPFALVSRFQSVPSIEIKQIPSLALLSQWLDQQIKTPNIFYMIRIDGTFNEVQLRSEHCQAKPYIPLKEGLPLQQTTFNLTNTAGTLIITRCPEYSSGITIAGFHYHYINSERTTGGHVFDLQLANAQVQINPIRTLQMQLIDSEAFDQTHVDRDTSSTLKHIE